MISFSKSTMLAARVSDWVGVTSIRFGLIQVERVRKGAVFPLCDWGRCFHLPHRTTESASAHEFECFSFPVGSDAD
jgi:hypothetical protein